MKQRLLSLFIVVLGVCTGAEAGNLMIGSTTLEVGKSYNSLNGPSSLWAGTITFTDATHVTFDGVTLNFNTANSIAISTDIPGLTITLVGENKIQGDGTKKGLYFSQSVTIKGDGSLDIVASENGIEGSGGNSLTVTDGHVKAKGGTCGIRLGSSGLYVKGKGRFEAYGGTKCLQGVKTLGEGSLVTAPEEAKFNTTALSVVDGSNNPISGEWVTIIKAITINETNFPDDNFREYLLEQTYGEDGILTDEEIAAVTEINVWYDNVASLKGIEFFTGLTVLICGVNDLTSLDVSKNTALKELYCYINQLTSLDVSKNTALEILDCASNQLTSLDVSKNTALTALKCGTNKLTKLDVSNCTLLNELTCSNNELTALNVSKNTALTILQCYQNQLTSLDVSKNTALTELQCYINQLTALDVSKNTALTVLKCGTNKLTTLDVSNCTLLNELTCSKNELTALDVSKNSALRRLQCSYNQLTSLGVSNNTALTTIYCHGNKLRGDVMTTFVNSLPIVTDGQLRVYDSEADKEYYSNVMTKEQVAVAKNTKGWKVLMHDGSSWVDYTGEIAIDGTNFPDDKFRWSIIDQIHDYNGYLSDAETAAVTSIDVSDKEIKSLKGIEYFTALELLNCSENQLTALDVSKNTALKELDCKYNQLTTLDVSQNTALTSLTCQGNSIRGEGMTALVNSLPKIEYGYGSFRVCRNETATGNKITKPQVAVAKGKHWSVLADNGSGWALYEGEPVGIAIDEKSFPDEYFRDWVLSQTYGEDGYLEDEEIAAVTEMDVSGWGFASLKGIEYFTALNNLKCQYNDLTSLDVSKNTALTSLDCSNNELTTLNVSNCTTLTSLDCSTNELITLDVSSNTALTSLNCSINELTTLDVSENTALTALDCGVNNLTALNLSSNTALTSLACSTNKLTTLDVSQNKVLAKLTCYNNAIHGTGMETFVNTLSDTSGGYLYYFVDYIGDSNLMTTTQAAVAKARGWKVLMWDSMASDWLDYEGLQKGDVNTDGIVDGKDVEDLTNYIMGKLSELDKWFYDADGNGVVNVADIVYVINIIKK